VSLLLMLFRSSAKLIGTFLAARYESLARVEGPGRVAQPLLVVRFGRLP
jgi:hypothetical protein